MTDPRVNRYRSGAKNPEREVITSQNDDGSLTVVVNDPANMRIVNHTFPGADEAQVEQGLTKTKAYRSC